MYTYTPNVWSQKPLCWLKAISRFKATTSGRPNFAYDILARTTCKADMRQLDLSKWSVAFNGSETVRASTIEQFSKTFESAGFRRKAFYPCYGMAEATLFVAGMTKETEPVLRRLNTKALKQHRGIVDNDDPCASPVVSCGLIREPDRVFIVDPDAGPGIQTHPLPNKHVGEVWIKSPSVAVGYW
jgi:acyl-CoA synthetase (AMP-forming)/AMP-acid ligase II